MPTGGQQTEIILTLVVMYSGTDVSIREQDCLSYETVYVTVSDAYLPAQDSA